MKKQIIDMLKHRRTAIISALLGAVAGYLYYRYVGCASGACIISANPYVSTVYGGIIGWLIGSPASGARACSRTEGREENE